jgi:hypothetical protein
MANGVALQAIALLCLRWICLMVLSVDLVSPYIVMGSFDLGEYAVLN